MDSCIFCRILAGEVPYYPVYQDDDVLAFLDVFPHAKGHTLVVPKKHVVVLQDMSSANQTAFMHGIDSAMRRIQDVLRPEGFTVGWNHGDAGGQVVKHLHAHIFPRWNADGGTSMHAVVNAPQGDVAEIAKLFFV
jgi:histidine triad (HIT) family protein